MTLALTLSFAGIFAVDTIRFMLHLDILLVVKGFRRANKLPKSVDICLMRMLNA